MPADWFATSGARELRDNSALDYREYVRRSEQCASPQFEEDLRQIELDLPRTGESMRLFLLRPEEREALDEDEELPPQVTKRFLPPLEEYTRGLQRGTAATQLLIISEKRTFIV